MLNQISIRRLGSQWRRSSNVPSRPLTSTGGETTAHGTTQLSPSLILLYTPSATTNPNLCYSSPLLKLDHLTKSDFVIKLYFRFFNELFSNRFKMALSGAVPPRGSAAAAASMRRRRTTSGGASGGAAGTMLQFYTDDAPGLKISPNVVLVMSIGFIAFVAVLHVMGKLYFVRRE
ncbi:hypothetical protein LWI29_005845 [Acer saccharum]|uniref:Protein transport protein Sec61 subunit beta n=2 Tax=Acer TaxID=4022 RepID=A0AA39W848_ACESA|nr:hypothetical protein LWI29_005845 [Acer saccharum]